jgi:hypothetical protein
MEAAVKQAIANLDSGTVGIGDDCLWQLTVTRVNKAHGPTGYNAPTVARQVFDSIVHAPPYNRFVYRQRNEKATTPAV